MPGGDRVRALPRPTARIQGDGEQYLVRLRRRGGAADKPLVHVPGAVSGSAASARTGACGRGSSAAAVQVRGQRGLGHAPARQVGARSVALGKPATCTLLNSWDECGDLAAEENECKRRDGNPQKGGQHSQDLNPRLVSSVACEPKINPLGQLSGAQRRDGECESGVGRTERLWAQASEKQN